MTPVTIQCIVEGQGEEQAIGPLVRRVCEIMSPPRFSSVLHPIRVPRSKLIRGGMIVASEVERVTRMASIALPQPGAVIILLDADEDCPGQLGPAVLQLSSSSLAGAPLAVVLAKCEFESWFVAAIESLCGLRGLGLRLSSPPDPETFRDAKGWLTERMEPGRAYSEVRDQPALASQMDVSLARSRSRSFDKFCREVERLIQVGEQLILDRW